MTGLDATGDEGISGEVKDQWKDGHVLTFWAYGYNHPGTTEYHLYYTQKDAFDNDRDTQRFTFSTYKQNDAEPKVWTHAFSFWAFKDKAVSDFKG